jgi:peptidoglycan/xylan/chitin deacetylase (PgdA/CDA1 family)
VQWLRANDAVTDVFAHGLSHRRIASGTEFGAIDAAVARERIRAGAEIFERALGRVPVGFVAPWDSLSRGSLAAATERFEVVSTGWLSRAHLPVKAWPSHLLERMARREALRVGTSWVLRHRGGKIGASVDPGDVPSIVAALTKGADVAVIVLHHWMFWGHPGAHPVVCALARALKGQRVLRLRDVAQHLRASRGTAADDSVATSFA